MREIIRLAGDPDTGIARLAAAVSRDRMLTHSVLRTADAASGFDRRVTDLSLAVGVLGLDLLRETVARSVVAAALKRVVASFFEYAEFWNHSIACGVVSRSLAAKHGVPEDEAFLAGLLHDTGFLLLDQYYTDAVSSGQGRRLLKPDHALENAVGMMHTEAGAWLVEHWGLGEGIVEAVREHHTPSRATVNPVLTAIVHTANVISARLALGAFAAEPAAACDPAALRILDIDGASLTDPSEESYTAGLMTGLDDAPDFDCLVIAIRRGMMDAITALPEREKVVFMLYYYEQLGYDDIAQVIRLTSAEAELLHRSAARRLALVLNDYCRRRP